MTFFEFICFDLITFLIKIVLILLVLLFFKDKLADYILDKQFNKSFGKLKDNIMSINFDKLNEEDSLTTDEPEQPTKF